MLGVIIVILALLILSAILYVEHQRSQAEIYNEDYWFDCFDEEEVD